MECMLHGTVAEQKGQCLCLVSFGQVNVQFRNRRQHASAYRGIHAAVAAQDTRSGCNTHMSCRSNLPEARFALSSVLLAHASLRFHPGFIAMQNMSCPASEPHGNSLCGPQPANACFLGQLSFTRKIQKIFVMCNECAVSGATRARRGTTSLRTDASVQTGAAPQA